MKHLKYLFWLLLAVFATIKIQCEPISDEEKEASRLIQEINHKLMKETNLLSEASWNYESNLTRENAVIKKEVQEKFAAFTKTFAMELLRFKVHNFKNETLKRMILKVTNIDDSILDPIDYSLMEDVIMTMKTTYAMAKVPKLDDNKQLLSLEPEITNILAKSKDPEELKYYWKSWYDLTGKPSEENFFKYVELRNKAARLNGFANGAESWLNEYEDATFEKQVETILQQLRPLLLQLHGYVRHKLHEVYGPKHVDLEKPIPMHLLGNIWGQTWEEIADLVIPYKNKHSVDVTDEMFNQNYTPLKMFQIAEDFFLSINMTKLPKSFWKKSIIEKPADGREMICHASAWDFAINDDVRIKQCTRVSMESFFTIHHEMGHIEYYLQYHNQPLVFRAAANPGFHEAVGDVVSLSVSTNKHLQRINLLKNFTPDKETEINQIFRMGLAKLVFLPFAYVMDKFRYEVFRGNVTRDAANCYFWKLREKFGGVEPAVARTNRDFDITAKFHASSDVEYMRYFVSFIVQFQFFRAACTKAGEYETGNPNKTLNDCDIYQNADAGNALKSMLAMGSSRPWPDALEAMTGHRKLDASAILEYFKPLDDWLIKTNKALGVGVGWKPSDKIDCSI